MSWSCQELVAFCSSLFGSGLDPIGAKRDGIVSEDLEEDFDHLGLFAWSVMMDVDGVSPLA